MAGSVRSLAVDQTPGSADRAADTSPAKVKPETIELLSEEESSSTLSPSPSSRAKSSGSNPAVRFGTISEISFGANDSPKTISRDPASPHTSVMSNNNPTAASTSMTPTKRRTEFEEYESIVGSALSGDTPKRKKRKSAQVASETTTKQYRDYPFGAYCEDDEEESKVVGGTGK